MEYGPEIKRGSDAWPQGDERPAWLQQGESLRLCFPGLLGGSRDSTVHGQISWPHCPAIRLPADHWCYRAISAGFVPWGGGENAPADLGGEVLTRDKRILPLNEYYRWQHDGMTYDIIGYKRTNRDTVTIARMSEDEARTLCFGHRAMTVLHHLGLIRPEPTEAERIAASTGLDVAVVQQVLDAR